MISGYKALKTYKTCIRIIIPIIDQLFQKINYLARKGTIIPISTKPL